MNKNLTRTFMGCNFDVIFMNFKALVNKIVKFSQL